MKVNGRPRSFAIARFFLTITLKRNNKHKRKAANENHGDEDDQESDDDKDADMRTSRRSASIRKRKHLTTFEVTEILAEKNVKSLVELQAFAHQHY